MKALKKYLPYILIIAGFVIISYAYSPYVLQGKIVNQSDISAWNGMANEIITHNEQHPEDPALWTGSMFSGMPATQISVDYKGDATTPLYNLLFWGERPPSYLIISLIGGFLLFLAFGINPYLTAVGAIAITFCSYNMQIIQVGHNTKMVAIAFMPWVMAALVYAYRKKYLLGAALFGLALSFQIKANHPQITYYLAFIVAGYAIAEMVGAIREKKFSNWFRTSIAVLVAGLLGIATNANKLLPTYEYAQYTMRGGSELSHDEENQTDGGLKLDYATAWSYGIEETLNMLVPNLNGGASSGELSKNSETYQILKQYYRNPDAIIKQMPLYWGPQPFTAGPMYMGAITIFLFILGLLVIKDRTKWWIIAVSTIALLLSWGSHFMWFSELFFRFAPLYNKFRTVSMILVILQITLPLLGIIALDKILNASEQQRKALEKSLLKATGITAGICLVLALFPGIIGDFASASDSMFGNDRELVEALRADRRGLLRSDAFTSMIFILIAAAAIFFHLKGSLKKGWAIGIVGAAILVNMWSIDKRYLNESHFYKRREFNNQYALRNVDKLILEDKDPNYRVLDLTVNTFNDAIVSYHHKTIGGYSPAKLQRYQDMIDFHISKEMNDLVGDINKAISSAGTISAVNEALGYYPVLAMLNTKYIVIDPSNPPLEYHNRLGNAWLVKSSLSAQNADQEMAALSLTDPATDAVIFNPDVEMGTIKEYSDEGTIELTSYSPNRLTYKYNAPKGGLAIFSEVYYPAGWKAYIDSQEVEILRANYILRGLELTPGEHTVEFVFAPESFKSGKNISLCSSIALILLLLGSIIVSNRQNIINFKK
ncbi:MAG: YfhO family protein [Bacteroidales bacterium]|nr:YfhO family protein [Bacteroidales bacterium]